MATPSMDLQPFQNAAGHGGVMQDAEGEIVVKPCTQAEIDFYQETVKLHPQFASFMPTYMGTLKLGDHTAAVTAGDQVKTPDVQPTAIKKIKTDTAIVLENVEYGYLKPNVVDLKLGARLYAPGTETEKAARLDKVASETTTGSLNFRVAGMKVWNNQHSMYDIYDKQYGRKFNAENVNEAFETFFKMLQGTTYAIKLLSEMLVILKMIEQSLTSASSRFYSSSILLVYEGDKNNLDMLVQSQVSSHVQTPKPDDTTERSNTDVNDDEEGGDEDEAEEPIPPFRLKLIDFAHSEWHQDEGPDKNVIDGLKNIETQFAWLITKNISK